MQRAKWFAFLLVIAAMAFLLTACGGGPDESKPADPTDTPVAVGDAAKGKATFDTVCFACHGEGGVGIQGLGKDMTHSTFIAGLSDAELLTFIKQGRDPGNPDNTTGVAMPPKGGNPALTDEQLMDVIAYIRTIHVDK